MLSRITRQDIYILANSRDVYYNGERMYYNAKVYDLELTYSADYDKEEVSATVSENSKLYKVKVLVETQSKKFLSHSCACNQHMMWRGACSHVIATLMQASSVVSIPKFTYKKISSGLMSKLEQNFLNELENDAKAQTFNSVEIIPSLYIGYDTLPYLNLSIGNKKFYIIKNIEELIQNINEQSTISYGRELSFKHSMANFDQKTIKFIGLLKRIVDTVRDMSVLTSYEQLKVRKNLPLTREFTDEFFELFTSDYLTINIKGHLPVDLEVLNEPPKLNVKVEFEDEEPKIVGKHFKYLQILGKGNSYFVADKIYKVSKSYADSVMPLIKALNESENGDIYFDKKDLHSFCAVVVPTLKKWNLIENEPEIPQSFYEQEAKAKAYLDASGKEVNLRLIFEYGNIEINPLGAENVFVTRQTFQELRVTKILDSFGFYKDDIRSVYKLTDDDLIYDFYAFGLEKLMQIAEVFTSDEFKKKVFTPSGIKSAFGIRFSGNLMELTLDSALNYSIQDLIEALGSYRIKKKYHKLKDGRFINLEDAGIANASEVLGSFEISKKDFKGDTLKLPKYRAMYLDSILKKQDSSIQDEQYLGLTKDFSEIGTGNVFQVPESLDETLRGYQKTGFEWLKTLANYQFGGILADDMGLGKTIQVIALILAEADMGRQNIVVSPTSLVYNWEREFNRFAPSLKIVVLTGMPQKRKELLETSTDANVFITTYDTLKRDIDNYEKITFRYVIADEAQYMKNPQTQNATAIKELAADARFALTGTPIENSLSELWSIFDFVMPGYLYSSGKFMRFFESPIIKENDEQKASELRRQIAPFILRRLKKDVLSELPDKVETNLFAEMESEQRKMYTAHLLRARGELESSSQIQILSELTRLRQICCHPALFAEDYKGGSGKLDLAMETIGSAIESGHRVLLFSQFTSMLSIIMKQLEKKGITYFYLDGQTPSLERLNMAEKFNEGEREIFVISLKAGGTGLNLTGADVVIHYDPWWNPATMNQATDRAHRFGQDKIVQVINIVAKDSIEEKILELQNKKKDLIDSVITEGGSFINKMSTEEILELFKD